MKDAFLFDSYNTRAYIIVFIESALISRLNIFASISARANGYRKTINCDNQGVFILRPAYVEARPVKQEKEPLFWLGNVKANQVSRPRLTSFSFSLFSCLSSTLRFYCRFIVICLSRQGETGAITTRSRSAQDVITRYSRDWKLFVSSCVRNICIRFLAFPFLPKAKAFNWFNRF